MTGIVQLSSDNFDHIDLGVIERFVRSVQWDTEFRLRRMMKNPSVSSGSNSH